MAHEGALGLRNCLRQYWIDFVCLNGSFLWSWDEYVWPPHQIGTTGVTTLTQLDCSERLSCAEADEGKAGVEVWCSLVNICHLDSLTQSAGLLPVVLIHFSPDHKLYPKIKPGSLI